MVTDRLIGHDLARYHIEAVLGRGGMGVVYRATDTRLGRTVALKVLSDERSADQDFRERFIRESRLLASIDHPNIVPIYEADEADGQLYIAMRYVPGPELRVIIADEAPMDATKTVAIIGQVADALDAAHAAGLVHRDVKPGNILVMPGATSGLAGHAYLTDFGLTKATGSDTGLTKIGQFVGTPGYVAPEQIEGRGVDHRVDVYALGCILYNCLSGDVPYPRDSTVASLWAHLKEPPPRLSEHRKGLPKGLDAVITQALAKSPDDRWQTCGALAQAARLAIEPARRKRAAVAGGVVAGASAAAVAGAAPDSAGAETAIDSDPRLADPTVVDADPAAGASADPIAAAAGAGSTVIESVPEGVPPVAAVVAAATVVDPTIDGASEAMPPDTTIVESTATVGESRDAMHGAMPATLVDSGVTSPPAFTAPNTMPSVDLPDAATVASAAVPTTTMPVAAGPVSARRGPGGRLAGRERPLAAVLATAVLIGVGLIGVNAIGDGGGSGGASPSPTSSSASVASADPGTYTALAGETLDSIAAKLGVTIDRLRTANPGLSGAVAVGTTIIIPVDEATALPSRSPAASGPPSFTPEPSPSTTPPAKTPPPKTPPPKPDDTSPPSNPTISIAGGAKTVFSTDVKLSLKAGGATQMRLGNVKGGSCDWGSWGDYKTSRSGWKLVGGGGGTRTVCVKFRDAAGNESGDRDSIRYDRKPVAPNFGTQCAPYADGGDVDVTATFYASDPDGDALHLSRVQKLSGPGSVAKTSSTKFRYSYGAGQGTVGTTVTIRYTLSDPYGGTDSGIWTLEFAFLPPGECNSVAP